MSHDCGCGVSHGDDVFRYEAERLKSFYSFGRWPLDFQYPEEMAEAGFYYTGHADTVRCYFCRVEIGSWQVLDIPMQDHRRWAPSCPFVRGQRTNNIPIEGPRPIRLANRMIAEEEEEEVDREGLEADREELQAVEEAAVEEREEERREEAAAAAEEEEKKKKSDINNNNNSNLGSNLGIVELSKFEPLFPSFTTEEERLDTFKLWPPSMPIRPDSLVEAGFYYTGFSDKCICFYCGVIIRRWLESDDIWERHALGDNFFSVHLSESGEPLTPTVELPCKFLLLAKGKAFVDKYYSDSTCNGGQAIGGGEDTCGGRRKQEAIHCDQNGAVEGRGADDGVGSEHSLEVSALTERNCNICYKKNGQEVCFLPCAHIVACTSCSIVLDICPICRTPIEAVLRVFIS